MADFMVRLDGARPQNGHASDGPISTTVLVEAEDWFDAREKTARRFHVAVFDPAMRAVEAAAIDAAAPLEEPAPASSRKPKARASRKR